VPHDAVAGTPRPVSRDCADAVSKSVKIWFITWPNGSMFEKTQTSADERQAWAKAMHSWLPIEWFPGLNLRQSYSAYTEIRQAMERAGFKCHECDVGDIVNGVEA
jgi:hypothetical protein